MARTQLEARLGSDKSIYSQETYPNVKHSSFNLSARYDMTCDPGMYFPVDWWFTLPGDHYKIQTRYILKSRPLVVSPFTPYRVRTHWFYARLVDLWKGAPTWTTKGRSGNLRPEFPTVNPNGKFFLGGNHPSVSFTTPQGLLSYLRLNPVYVPVEGSTTIFGYDSFPRIAPVTVSDSAGTIHPAASTTGYKLPNKINALLPFMYQKCYRFDMTIPNLLQDSKVWFPDDVSDGWRINYEKTNLGIPSSGSSVPHTSDFFFHPNSVVSNIDVGYSLSTSALSPTVSDKAVNILLLRHCLYERDRFSTALPTNLRGSAAKIDIDSNVVINVNGKSIPVSPGYVKSFQNSDVYLVQNSNGTLASLATGGSLAVNNSSNSSRELVAGSKFQVSGQNATFNEDLSGQVSGISLDLNQFRNLIALTVWQERNEQTQGDYNSTIYAHFHVDPRHDDYEPKYIGGTSDVVYFDELVQDMPTNVTISGSNTERPAGSRSGLVDQQASGSVGDFTCPDYGFIMGIMFISPEVSYANGVERPWLMQTQEDLYFPEDEGLGLEEVLNYELRASDNDSENNGLFGYQNRSTDMKSRLNRSLGWYSVPPSVDAEFSARAQSRIFMTTPKLSHNLFVESVDNLRRDWLAKPNDPAFELNYATILRGNRPMAYRSVPETFGF